MVKTFFGENIYKKVNKEQEVAGSIPARGLVTFLNKPVFYGIIMKKRGQVYLIAAIVICLLLFILLSGSNIFKRIFVQDRFSDIAKNYEIESSKYINEIVKSGDDVGIGLRDFTETFIKRYSNNIDLGVGMLYVFAHKDGFWVFNYLAKQEGEENIKITYEGLTPPLDLGTGIYSCAHSTEGCSFGSCIEIDIGDFTPNSCVLDFSGEKGKLELQIGDITYGPFSNKDIVNPTLVFIFKKAKENTVKVFINDKNEGRGRNSEESED